MNSFFYKNLTILGIHLSFSEVIFFGSHPKIASLFLETPTYSYPGSPSRP